MCGDQSGPYGVGTAFEFTAHEALNHRIENGLHLRRRGDVAEGWLLASDHTPIPDKYRNRMTTELRLREVYVQPERFLDHFGVEVESIGGQLDLIGKAFVKISHKCPRVLDGTFTDAKRRDEFSFRVHRHKDPLVADLAVTVAYLALFLLNERPDFIALHIAAVKPAQSRIQQLLAALSERIRT